MRRAPSRELVERDRDLVGLPDDVGRAIAGNHDHTGLAVGEYERDLVGGQHHVQRIDRGTRL
jgi:hypothetical protein